MRQFTLGLACGAAVFVAMSARPAVAAPMLLADLATGQVIAAEEATRPWHPASVTKLMTVYVALKQIRAGKLKLETPLAVSQRAAASPPSKIGVKPGQTLTVEDALRILMVKSANDVAVVVAEGVGGSVEGFAKLMNDEAEAIGMRESRFLNPHGLYAEGQQSSARDMAVLARRLMLDFPQHRALFSIGAIRLDDKIMENTNGVIGRYPGATGMKTGFICASGFNVVATAKRDGRELVAVVFGSPSAVERTLKTMQMFDEGFARRNGAATLDVLPDSGETAPPDMREAICGRRGPAMGEAPEAVVAAATAAKGEGAGGAVVVATAEAAAPAPRLGTREIFEPIPVHVVTPVAKTKTTVVAETGKPAPVAKPSGEEKTAAKPVAKPAPKKVAKPDPETKTEPKVAAAKPAAATAATTKPDPMKLESAKAEEPRNLTLKPALQPNAPVKSGKNTLPTEPAKPEISGGIENRQLVLKPPLPPKSVVKPAGGTGEIVAKAAVAGEAAVPASGEATIGEAAILPSGGILNLQPRNPAPAASTR